MKQILFKISFISVLCIAFSSCGTIVNGTRQDVAIASNPPGATVTDGNETWRAPTSIRLPRKKSTVLTFTKPGYETRTVQVHSEFSAWTIANVFLVWPLSPVWVAIDACSGGMWKLAPEAITCELQPLPISQNDTPVTQTNISSKEIPESEQKKT
jgi:hypothetical protein